MDQLSPVGPVYQAGTLSGNPLATGGATVVKIDLERLAELVKQRPDATIRELHALLGADCVESAVCMALKRLGLSFKKRRSTRRSKTART